MTEDDRATVERQLGNRYQIVRTLGAGAFGAVYLARERDLHRLVAIKVLRGDRAWSDEERERLLREARTIANLSHPAVVPLLAFGVNSTAWSTWSCPMSAGRRSPIARRSRTTSRSTQTKFEESSSSWPTRSRTYTARACCTGTSSPRTCCWSGPGRSTTTCRRAFASSTSASPRFPCAIPASMPRVRRGARRTSWHPSRCSASRSSTPQRDLLAWRARFLLLGGRLPFDATSPTERLTQQRKGPVVPLSVCAPDAPKDLVQAIERCLAYDAEQRWRRARDFRDSLIAGAGAGNSLTPLALVVNVCGRIPRRSSGSRPSVASVNNRGCRSSSESPARSPGRRGLPLRRARSRKRPDSPRGDRDLAIGLGATRWCWRRRSARPAPCAGGQSESPRRDSGATRGPGSNGQFRRDLVSIRSLSRVSRRDGRRLHQHRRAGSRDLLHTDRERDALHGGSSHPEATSTCSASARRWGVSMILKSTRRAVLRRSWCSATTFGRERSTETRASSGRRSSRQPPNARRRGGARGFKGAIGAVYPLDVRAGAGVREAASSRPERRREEVAGPLAVPG